MLMITKYIHGDNFVDVMCLGVCIKISKLKLVNMNIVQLIKMFH